MIIKRDRYLDKLVAGRGNGLILLTLTGLEL